MRLANPADMAVLPGSGGSVVKKAALWLKEGTERILFGYLSPVPAAVMDAMVLGEKRGIPRIITDSMMKTGTIHILPRLYTKMPPVAL